MKIKLAKSELIHFVGIGGIGMSGLALIMKDLGFKVQGSDIANNKNIERVKQKKINIFIGHKKQNVNKSTILVISSAIKMNNPEVEYAKKLDMNILVISALTNFAAGIENTILTHEDVLTNAKKIAKDFSILLLETINSLNKK